MLSVRIQNLLVTWSEKLGCLQFFLSKAQIYTFFNIKYVSFKINYEKQSHSKIICITNKNVFGEPETELAQELTTFY